MRIDPMQNWRSLTDYYARMSDGELLAVAEDYRDLIDTARQVLRDEMRKRNLGDPQSIASAGSRDEDGQLNSAAFPLDSTNATDDAATPEEFVWKNVLCDCNDREEAWQIREVLRRAGIESWIDGSRTNSAPLSDLSLNQSRPRLLVAADQLDSARAVLSQPIPQDIVEQSKAEEVEYAPPVCPACGAPNPILESADPTNSWKCEDCGKEWSEAAPQSE